MCHFFSCVSDGNGKIFYFNAKMRARVIAGETPYQDTDSHTSIADFFGYRGNQEDTLNKYEYDPLTGKFVIDRLNNMDDSFLVEQQVRALDWSTVVPELIIKPIVHPLRDVTGIIDETAIALLKEWTSVRDSIRGPVWAWAGDSVRASIKASVGDSVGASVGDSVRASVRDSVWASVGDSVGASVRDSVEASVWDSVWAYIGSFFNPPQWKYVKHDEGVYPFQPAVDLWDQGLVPSFDGKVWRLHSGGDARIRFEILAE